MAETTTDETEMTREETATFLRSIADELGSGGGRVGIPVGNKEIGLSPPETVDVETTVTERSSRLRKDTEELTLRFKWNPAKDGSESSETGKETEADAGTRTESNSGAGTEPGSDR